MGHYSFWVHLLPQSKALSSMCNMTGHVCGHQGIMSKTRTLFHLSGSKQGNGMTAIHYPKACSLTPGKSPSTVFTAWHNSEYLCAAEYIFRHGAWPHAVRHQSWEAVRPESDNLASGNFCGSRARLCRSRDNVSLRWPDNHSQHQLSYWMKTLTRSFSPATVKKIRGSNIRVANEAKPHWQFCTWTKAKAEKKRTWKTACVPVHSHTEDQQISTKFYNWSIDHHKLQSHIAHKLSTFTQFGWQWSF